MCRLPTLSRNATFVRSALPLICILGIMAGEHQTSVAAQDVEVVEDGDAYAVYRAVLPIEASSGDRELPHITLLQDTRAGRMDCPRDESIQAEWRSVVENYRSVNDRVKKIQAGRDLGVPYTLLSWSELTRMMRSAGYDLSKLSGRQSPGAEVFSRLKGGGLVALSAVGFDAAKNRERDQDTDAGGWRDPVPARFGGGHFSRRPFRRGVTRSRSPRTWTPGVTA